MTRLVTPIAASSPTTANAAAPAPAATMTITPHRSGQSLRVIACYRGLRFPPYLNMFAPYCSAVRSRRRQPGWHPGPSASPRAVSALAFVPCKGACGPLTRIPPRPPASRARSGPGKTRAVERARTGPLSRLADYLDQHGGSTEGDQVPSAEFWAATAAHALPAGQAVLGDAAHARGLYRDAAQLHKTAAASAAHRAALYLSHPRTACGRPSAPRTGPPPTPPPRTVLRGSLREAGG